MDTVSVANRSGLDRAPRGRSVIRLATIGALAATVANLALWAGGRAADVGFRVTPLVGDSAMQVGLVEVVATTLFAFAAGLAVLALAARRSRRWARFVIAAAGVFAVVSTSGPLSTANDTATGVLLAAIHLATGTAFVATAAKMTAR